MQIQNPILPGFHPDPSICRVGDDYYIANSTFNWFPGVRLNHSRDLCHWQFVGYALTRKTQLDLIGNEEMGGIWAPCLSFSDGIFYLIYTNTRAWMGPYKDSHNYLVTARDIRGPWSDPIYLNSSGFDPSLFHDKDGRKWFVNVQWDHRMSQNPFSGILLQEYVHRDQRLAGPVWNIFQGTSMGLVEAPHLYRRGDWYYLVTAEGGTSFDHAATLARARDIRGPYEVAPHNPILTSRNNPSLELQRAGHGDFVETSNGQWYFAHLCGRPIMPMRRCILGRETGIQKFEWTNDDWPILATGGNEPSSLVEGPDLPLHPFAHNSKNNCGRDDFDTPTLNPEFNSLRDPADDSWLSLSERPGCLRLYGRESLYSKHHQSLIARRIVHLNTEAVTRVTFLPDSLQQMAGLIFYYDCTNYHYLRITWANDEIILGVLTSEAGNLVEYPNHEVPVSGKNILLKGILDGPDLQFLYRDTSDDWIPIGPSLDATVLSDEYKCETKFTGAFAGMCVQDMTGRRLHADFDYFEIGMPGNDF